MALTRDSYVYYFDPFYEMANETYTNLSIIFRTSELNGLLFWNGQVRYALVYFFFTLDSYFSHLKGNSNI